MSIHSGSFPGGVGFRPPAVNTLANRLVRIDLVNTPLYVYPPFSRKSKGLLPSFLRVPCLWGSFYCSPPIEKAQNMGRNP